MGNSLGAALRTWQPFLVSEALDWREAPAQQGRGLGRGRESNLCRTLRIRLNAKNYQEQTQITEADPLSLQGARCRVQSHCWLEPGPPPYSFQGPAGPRESVSSLRCVGSLTPSSGCSLLGGTKPGPSPRVCCCSQLPNSVDCDLTLPIPCPRGGPPHLSYRRTPNWSPSQGDGPAVMEEAPSFPSDGPRFQSQAHST